MPEQFYDVASYVARDSVGYLVRRLTTIFTGKLEAAFAAQQFTLTQWGVLMHLRDGLARTASDLACAFQHDSGALTRVLDQLESRGLIARKRSSRDRRVVELHVTEAGQRAIRQLLPTVVDTMNAALAPLSRAEFEQFRTTLVKVLDHQVAARPPRAPGPPTAAGTRKAATRGSGTGAASPRRASARSAPRRSRKP